MNLPPFNCLYNTPHPHRRRHPFPGQHFHHSMLTVFIAEGVKFDHKYGSGSRYYADAYEGVDADGVEDGKYDQKQYYAASEVPDVLRFQPFEFDAFINALVDVVYAVGHDVSVLNSHSRCLSLFCRSVFIRQMIVVAIHVMRFLPV